MSYLVLARKWRPRRFAEMAGQEHVLRALVNALEQDRLHHAFLFAGTRGVGKTTVARILAKAINCESGVSAEPCGNCSACTEIDEGRFVDLIEVDAASRTRVDDTRELLDNVQYAPTRGRYKVYLIDEVHMLSAHSFNALLKTLEEPPPHVKFLLATTDPQKLPVTVLSRCLQFNLKRLSPALIEERMAMIVEAEKVAAEEGALRRIALAADGSMRDGLSLLDQAIAYGAGTLRDADVATLLGSIDQRHVLALLEALADGDGPALMTTVNELDQDAPDFSFVLDELASQLQRIAMAQVVPEALDINMPERKALLSLAEAIPPEDVQLYYQIALMGRRDLPLAPEPRAGFEMILLRMIAFRPADIAPLAAGGRKAPGPAAAGGRGKPGPARRAATGSQAGSGGANGQAVENPSAARSGPGTNGRTLAASKAAPTRAPAKVPEPGESTESWNGLLQRLDIQGAARQLAANCVLLRREQNLIELQLDAAHQALHTPQQQKRLEAALADGLGHQVSLRIRIGELQDETPARQVARKEDERLDAARAALEQDPNVRSLEQAFGAKLRLDTVEPHGGEAESGNRPTGEKP